MEATRYVSHPKYRAIIFRRTHPEMLDILDRMHAAYPTMGAEYRAGEHRWYFPSGAKVHLGHMADEDSHYQYQGKEYHYVGFDEAGQFIPKQLAYLFSRCRTTVPEIPKRIRYASNPGGPSHQYLKDRFRIGQFPEGYRTFEEEILLTLPNGQKIHEKIHRVFIPGKVWDNPSLIENDPGYIAFLTQLPELERMRLMDGRWDAFEGQMFQELNKEVHGIGPNEDLPVEWECFGAFDWGYARPWAYGLWRVDYDGNLYLDRMHYATRENMTNVGTRQTDTEIARTIRNFEEEHKLRPRWRVAGPDIFNPKRKRDGMMGPAPAEEMAREGIHFIKADDTRIIGWQQIHHRLRVDEDGSPHLFARVDLEHWWRTMWALQEDPNNPEDISQKDIEDHLPEMTRYACMTRPMRPKIRIVPDVGSFQVERRKFLKAKQLASRKGISLAAAYGRI
jgi:hypothetical protein